MMQRAVTGGERVGVGYSGFPWVGGLVLMGLVLVVRLPGLMGLPIFGDEAIYLRWAQLIRESPWENLFVSLADPKPPMHYWLMALVWPLTADPLLSARLLSVAAGVLTVPALILACIRLETFVRERKAGGAVKGGAGAAGGVAGSGGSAGGVSGRSAGLLVAVLAVFCPFLAFYQRMALADALFVLETVVAFWLSLRLAAEARHVTVGVWRGVWTVGLPLGVAMGVMMLTRQIVSYAFWVVPVAAFVLQGVPRVWVRKADAAGGGEGVSAGSVEAVRPGRGAMWGRFGAWMVAAVVVAVVMWWPYLTWPHGHDVKSRILYQSRFSEPLGAAERVDLAVKNFANVFVPTVEGVPTLTVWPDNGWLWVYMTPVVYVASVVALGVLAGLRQWRVLGVLLVYFGLFVGPLVVFGNITYSRYVLAAVVPLLMGLGWVVAWGLGWLLSGGRVWGWVGAGAVVAGLLAWPLYDMHVMNGAWKEQRLIPRDRYQYVTGWTAGQGAREAIGFIEGLGEGPVVVITDNAWGTPADAVWVYLSGREGVRLYWLDEWEERGILRPAPVEKLPADAAGMPYYLLKDRKWIWPPEKAVGISPEVPVLFVTHDMSGEGAKVRKKVERWGGVVDVFTFGNVTDDRGRSEKVMVFRLQ